MKPSGSSSHMTRRADAVVATVITGLVPFPLAREALPANEWSAIVLRSRRGWVRSQLAV